MPMTPEYAHYRSIRELPPHWIKEVHRFFLDSKVLENKVVTVEDSLDRHQALRAVQRAIEFYAREQTRLRV